MLSASLLSSSANLLLGFVTLLLIGRASREISSDLEAFLRGAPHDATGRDEDHLLRFSIVFVSLLLLVSTLVGTLGFLNSQVALLGLSSLLLLVRSSSPPREKSVFDLRATM